MSLLYALVLLLNNANLLLVRPYVRMHQFFSYCRGTREILYCRHENISRKSKFVYSRAKISGTLHKDLSDFIIIDGINRHKVPL